jgi:adenosine deaminase
MPWTLQGKLDLKSLSTAVRRRCISLVSNVNSAVYRTQVCFSLRYTGEVACRQDKNATDEAFLEAKEILDFGPDRLGHALLLPRELQETLLRKKIPVESCPTSNVMTLELASRHSGSVLAGMESHPQLEDWIKRCHPFSICTDDPGVFNTNNTKELVLVQKAFGLCDKDICNVIASSMDHAFCSIDTRAYLKMTICDRIEHVLRCPD